MTGNAAGPTGKRWPTVADWIGAIEQHPRGLLVLSNVKHDCLRRGPSDDLFDAFFGRLDAALATQRAALTPGADPERLAVIFTREIEQLGREAAFRLQNTQTITAAGPWARTFNAWDFVWYNVEGGSSGLRYKDPDTLAVGDVETHVYKKDWVKDGTRLGEPHGIAWAAPMDDVVDIGGIERARKRFTPDDAFRLRAALGLCHLKLGRILVLLVYPDDIDSSITIKAPTFVEGGTNEVYRSVVAPGQCGFAVKLDSWDHGSREIVHGFVDLTDAFEPKVIAKLDTNCAATPFDIVFEGCDEKWQPGVDTLETLIGGSGT